MLDVAPLILHQISTLVDRELCQDRVHEEDRRVLPGDAVLGFGLGRAAASSSPPSPPPPRQRSLNRTDPEGSRTALKAEFRLYPSPVCSLK